MGPSKRLKALQQEKSDLVARMESLLNAADGDYRDLTADEEKDYHELEAQLPALDRRIEREQTFLNAQASQQPIRDTREEAAARCRSSRTERRSPSCDESRCCKAKNCCVNRRQFGRLAALGLPATA